MRIESNSYIVNRLYELKDKGLVNQSDFEFTLNYILQNTDMLPFGETATDMFLKEIINIHAKYAVKH